MFLRRLVLDNVRSIEHLELDFSAPDGDSTRQWTFVLGDNGAGKSTILKSIALVLAGTDALAELMRDPADWIRFGAERATISLDFATADEEPRHAEIQLSEGDTMRDVYRRTASSLAQVDDAVAHTPRNWFTVGYGVSRHPTNDSFSVSKGGQGFSHPRARSVSTLFAPEANLVPLETWAMDLDYRTGNLAVVREALDQILPGVSFAEIDRERRELMFETPDGRLPYRLLSDGYQNVAAWIGDLLFQISEVFENYSRPLETRGVLLIDEVGLHLHPTWQRQVVGFLTERLPNMQIVTTTHSPLMVHQAGDGELFFLRRDTARAPARLIPYEGAPNLLRLDQLLTGPAFGLASLDSKPVEELKSQYRDRRDSSRDPANDDELKRLTALVGELPRGAESGRIDRRLASLLEEVESTLSESVAEDA